MRLLSLALYTLGKYSFKLLGILLYQNTSPLFEVCFITLSSLNSTLLKSLEGVFVLKIPNDLSNDIKYKSTRIYL